MKSDKLPPETHAYLCGYWDAINAFGIWNNGVQSIGCLVTPIKGVMQLKLSKYEVQLDEFLYSREEVEEANE
jgi:hypothetical protein